LVVVSINEDNPPLPRCGAGDVGCNGRFSDAALQVGNGDDLSHA
jgi:hypothetical protein